MNNRLVKVCEDILNDENEFKKFFGIKTLGEIYDYLKGKVPDLSSDEFGYFVARVLEESEKQKGDSNVINLEKLEKIAGGKGFGKRLASGGLALASLFTSQPSLYAAKAGKTEQHTDSYLSGKELGDKDSKDRSERSEGNSSSALGHVASILGGAVVGAVAAAGVAYKYWSSSNSGASVSSSTLSGNLDPATMLFDYTMYVKTDFEKAALNGDSNFLNKMQFQAGINSTGINNYSMGLCFALACGHYEFVDKFLNKFVDSVSDTKPGLREALLFYMFCFSVRSDRFPARYACKNLVEHYGVLSPSNEQSRIIGTKWDGPVLNFTGYKLAPNWCPLAVVPELQSVIDRNDIALLRIIFRTGDVKPTDCLEWLNKSRNPFAEANFVRLVRDMGLANLNDKGIYDELIKILQANKANIRDLPIFVQLYPQVLDWWFDDEGNHVAAGTSKSHHLLMYAILRHSWNCAFVLADNEILPNWWSITDNKSKSPFEYINFLLSRDSHKSAEIDMKQFYCALWDKAVAQGARLDQNLSPETLGYRPAPALNPHGGGGDSL